MIKSISEDKFAEIKETIGQAEQAVKRVPIKAISVDSSSLIKQRILVNGQPVSVSDRFFFKLGSMLKLNVGLTREMLKSGDHKIASLLINGLKDYAASKRVKEVMLIANTKSREVVDICTPNRYKRVTNDTLFDVTERILNDNSKLSLETVDYNPYNGTASINLLNNDEVGFAQAGKDEFFKFGFSLIQTNKDTIVESYNQRLICSNGLRTSLGEGAISNNITFEDKFRLMGTGAEDVKIFLNKIDLMKKSGFQPSGFEAAINKATQTKASLHEIESAFRLSTDKLNEGDASIKKQYQSAIARNYFHSYGDAMSRVIKKGHDPLKMTDRQKAFVKTGMTIWDVVNSMTFLGSNNAGFPLDNQHELKYKAGELFAKGTSQGYDLEFAQYANL
tara:strand:+ start:197 stop:1369 length:1173 start_codon:yes stop_codon:yes gene_type:complete